MSTGPSALIYISQPQSPGFCQAIHTWAAEELPTEGHTEWGQTGEA